MPVEEAAAVSITGIIHECATTFVFRAVGR
jgi:hypothetical protein